MGGSLWRVVITKTYRNLTYSSIMSAKMQAGGGINSIYPFPPPNGKVNLTFLKQPRCMPAIVQIKILTTWTYSIVFLHSLVRSRRNNTIRLNKNTQRKHNGIILSGPGHRATVRSDPASPELTNQPHCAPYAACVPLYLGNSELRMASHPNDPS